MEDENCSLSSLRLDVQVYGSVAVDEHGEVVDPDDAIESIMDNVKEWQPCEHEPYYWQACGGLWNNWQEAKAHIARGEQ